MEIYYLLVFNSTHAAIQAQKDLNKYMKVVVVPTLREITASCGISLRIANDDYEKFLSILKDPQNGVRLDTKLCRLYQIIHQDKKNHAEQRSLPTVD